MEIKLNRTLKTRAEVDECTELLRAKGLIEHGLSCKNPDIYLATQNIGDGNIVDLGADGSWILANAVKMGLTGRKCGIDFHLQQDKDFTGMEMIEGDLMATPYPNGEFHFATCMSVVEHSVSYSALAKECARILKSKGTLIISADYWDPAPDTSLTKLYNLDWKILNKEMVMELVSEMEKVGLKITSEIDFTTQEQVINDKFCSPVSGVGYTFIYLHFIKD